MTHAYATFFDVQQVDATVGEAYEKLSADWERRRQYVDKKTQIHIDARLGLLRHVWTLMVERSPE